MLGGKGDFKMKINGAVFGELEFDYIGSRDTTINFWGKETNITLMVKGDEDGLFEEEQYKAYNSLMQNWKQLQPSFLQSILDYYKQKRHSLEYDIETNDQLLERINLEGIVVSYVGSFEGRDIGILFNCTWDKENGLGLRLVNEEIIEIGYRDVAI
jgi:hypothetical protein